MNSLFQEYGLLALFLFLRVLGSTTEESDSYTEPYTSNDFENSTTGEYNTTNTADEAVNDYLSVSINALNIIKVSPTEIVVDTTTELQLSIANYTGTNSTPTLCILSSPDNDMEVLPSYWISDTQINCTGFCPLVSGLFSVTVDSSGAPMNFDEKVTIKVISKKPFAERGEYSYNFDKIFIYFDANIELNSNCASTFSKKSLEYFGAGFRCTVMGDALIVKMGVDFKLTTVVEIRAGNKICRSGSGKEFCLAAKPGVVDVTPPKIPGPVLSLLTTSDCTSSTPQKYMNLKLSSNNQKQSSGEVSPLDNLGKSQRKNLMMWRTLRRIQNKLLSNLTLKIDKSDMQSVYENLATVEQFLGNENIESVSSRSGVTVSVHVQSSPTVGTILAEANVMFCKNFNQPFRYKWIVNEKPVTEDGKLLTVQDVTPGKYLIKCNIVAYNSSDVLGQGWTTTEIFDSRPKVIVYPVEIVTGTTEDVSLHAVAWHVGTISWACRTNFDKVCMANSHQLISDILDMNSSNISIPAGVLPVGEYIWTVENAHGVNTARVIIKLESVVTINVKVASVFVKEPQKIVLQGMVKGLQKGCRLWWSSVRKRGFNYINLQNVGGNAEVTVRDGETEHKIDLLLPRSLKSWKALEPDSLYMFKLQAFCPHSGSLEYKKIPISVNNPPRVSSVKVEPSKGLAMVTNFIISEVQADDSAEDYPLLFEWSYLDTCKVEIPITRGAYSRKVTTFLPPGDITVILRVCDVRRACSEVLSSVIDVSHSKTVPENFQNAANQIYCLIASGDYLEAFGLATTVFKSLALKPETEIRRTVFRSIEEGIYTRIKTFNKSMKGNPKAIKSYLDFVERALNVAKYFPKSSGINGYLTGFKNSVSNSVFKKN